MCSAIDVLAIKNIAYRGINLVDQFKVIPRRPRAIALQRFLFQRLTKENLRLEVKEGPGNSVELHIRIRTAS